MFFVFFSVQFSYSSPPRSSVILRFSETFSRIGGHSSDILAAAIAISTVVSVSIASWESVQAFLLISIPHWY